MCLYGIHGDLHVTPSIEVIFYVIYPFLLKGEVKIKSHVMTVVRYMWYASESRSFIQAQCPL